MGRRWAGRFFVATFVGMAVLLGARGAQCGAPAPNPVVIDDPLGGGFYELSVDGMAAGYYAEVDGIGSENEVVETKILTKTGYTISKIPGQLKFLDVTLKRGITSNMDAWQWRQMVVDDKFPDARKNASIIMYDQAMNAVARWDFVNIWPSKITAPGLASPTGALAVEELTLVHEGCRRMQ